MCRTRIAPAWRGKPPRPTPKGASRWGVTLEPDTVSQSRPAFTALMERQTGSLVTDTEARLVIVTRREGTVGRG